MSVEVEEYLIKEFYEKDKLELITQVLDNIKKLEKYEFTNEYQIEFEELINKLEESLNKRTQSYYLFKLLLFNNSISYYNNLLNYIKLDNKTNDFAISINKKLKSTYEIINNYRLISYKSGKSIKETFENTTAKETEESAKKIDELMKNINLASISKTSAPFFEYCQDSVELAFNIKNIATNEEGLKSIIEYLYKGVYECTGNFRNNRIKKLYEEEGVENPNFISTLKKYRNFYDHSLVESKSKLNFVTEKNKEIINKLIPTNPSEYMKIQLYLYNELIKMLEFIFEALNN